MHALSEGWLAWCLVPMHALYVRALPSAALFNSCVGMAGAVWNMPDVHGMGSGLLGELFRECGVLLGKTCLVREHMISHVSIGC